MGTYTLDDLTDWGRVLDELKELKRLHLLDEYQDGLKRILRYRWNWRLRECALQYAKEVALPRDDLIEEVCSIMCDEGSYTELRMLAAETLGHLARARLGKAEGMPSFKGVSIPEKMRQLFAAPVSPLLRQKLVDVFKEVTATEMVRDE